MLHLPELYSKHLQKQFSAPQYLLLLILINLLENLKTVKLEELARRFPFPIQLRSRIKKLQRFLSLPQFKIKSLWFPIFESWIKREWNRGEVIYLVIDRSQWRNLNLLMVSIVYDHRAIPVDLLLLEKQGNSNLAQQQQVLLRAFFSGQTIKSKGIAKYVTRPTETNRTYRRHSSFSIGLHGQNWLNSISFFQDVVRELLSFSPHKRLNYLKGMRAASLMQSAL